MFGLTYIQCRVPFMLWCLIHSYLDKLHQFRQLLNRTVRDTTVSDLHCVNAKGKDEYAYDRSPKHHKDCLSKQ